jgi:hypothetical protein
MSVSANESCSAATSERAENARSGESVTHFMPDQVERVVHSVSGTLPKQEDTAKKNVPSPYGLPPDAVEMQHDPEIKNQIIVQYLDKTRNVIVQLPSEEELELERPGATLTVAGKEGENTHGD